MTPLVEGIARAALVILVNGLWQGAVIAAITWGALRLSPRVNASTRYAAWTLALIASLIVPVATSLTHISYETISHASPAASERNPVAPKTAPAPKSVSTTKESAATVGAPHLSLPQSPSVTVAPPAVITTAFFALWALAAAALIVRLAVALLALERLKRDAMPLGMEYRERLEQWQAHSEVDRDVRICVTEGIEVPVAVGLFDAMVLLPRHLLDTLDANEIDQISLHELAHLLRHDDWSNSFQRVTTALLFFNPVVWFIARQMDIEREVACDDYVLQLTGAVRNYAYCLTKMAEMTSWPHQPLAAPGVFITRKNISIRIERLLRTGRAISSSISPATAAAVVAGLVVSFALAGVVTPMVAFALPAAARAGTKLAAAVEPTPAPRERQRSHEATPSPAPQAPARPAIFSSPETVNKAIGETANVNKEVAQVLKHTLAQALAPAAASRGGKVAVEPGCIGCDFSGANMPGKDFRNADLSGSDFDRANLQGARFDKSNVTGVNFSHANLRDASFAGANMSGCDLDGANLSGARFDGAQLTGCTVNTKDLAPGQARVFLAHCMGCDFANANFSGQDLRGIKLVGIDLERASFHDANLAGASFTGVDFSGADFTGANLNGATFNGCDFTGANLRNVDLTHTNFIASSLSGAHMKP